MNGRQSFEQLLTFYQDHLYDQVMPFWTTHGIDWDHGGVYNVMDDDGTVQSTDKLVWSQGRALWTFSALYNLDGDTKWLDIAHDIADFLLANGRDSSGAWVFCLNQDGTVAEPHKSVYADAFAMYGLTEYARATGDQQALEAATETFRRTSPLLDDHDSLLTEPLPIPEGMQSHGPSMSFALVYHELGVTTDNQQIIDRALELAEIVMTQHLKPQQKLLYEFVRPSGELVDSDAGRTIIPGHVIESMWFMEKIYRHHQRQDRIDLAMEAIRWHLKMGWDDEYGGLFLACHTQGGPPVWHQPDAKVWWSHTEALYALLRAYQLTRQPWCMQWYWRVHDYAFEVFPNWQDGDWHQNLNRRGEIMPVAVTGLQVKDPFHLPRSLIYSILTLQGLAGGENAGGMSNQAEPS